MAQKSSYTAGRFALFTDGSEPLGFIKSVSGGNIKGEVAMHQLGPDNTQKKHLATIKHEDITVECGMGMGRGWYDWIKNSFDKNAVMKSGELVAANFNYEAQRATLFYDAYISELTLPAFDAKSKDSAYMTVKITPTRLRHEKRGGERIDSAKIGTKAKKWLCSAFKFELGSLPCARVSKIDSITLKQAIVEDQVGAFREPTKHPAKVEVPNLKITLSAADADAWADWHRTFVIDGQCTDSDELNGSLTFLAPDHKEELGRIDFLHVGIISIQTAKAEANKEEIMSVEVECYVENMQIFMQEVDA